MFLIRNREDCAVVDISKNVGYQDNGYPIDREKNIAYVKEYFDVVEIQTVPKEAESYKYCYTPEKGFYLNPNWQPPSPYPTVLPEVVELIKADYTAELITQGVI